MRRVATPIALLALAALAGLGAYRTGLLQLVRPDPAAYPVRGSARQFSETGRVAGIAGPVDLDVLRPGATLLDLGRVPR